MSLSHTAEAFFGTFAPADSPAGRILDAIIDSYGGTPAPIDGFPDVCVGFVGSQPEAKIWLTVHYRRLHPSFSEDDSVEEPVLLVGERPHAIKKALRSLGIDPADLPVVGWWLLGGWVDNHSLALHLIAHARSLNTPISWPSVCSRLWPTTSHPTEMTMKTWIEMTEEERAEQKALHARVRADMHAAAKASGYRHRYMLLVWAYIRGLPYRRIERNHHVQDVGNGKTFEHNMPSATELTKTIAKYVPDIASDMATTWTLKPGGRVEAWLADPSGAIPAPASRPKKPYVRPPIAAE